MKIARINFDNYRTLTDASVTLGRRTVLIGANGTGKTSILEALDSAFGAGRRGYGFRETDLADGDRQLTIDFTIVPDDDDTFTVDEHTLFETHVDIVDDVEVICIRVVAGSEDDGIFRTRGYFVKADGDEDGTLDNTTRTAIGFFFLGASRDSQREFDDRGGLWARLSTLLEAAHDPQTVEALTTDAGRDLVRAVLGDDRLDELAETVERFVAVLPTGTPLSAELRATAVDFRSLLRGTNLVVGEGTDLAPLREHSTGLQSLALFGLFSAFLETAGGSMLAVGLEEPEIHLSPHVGRSLVTLASEPGHQVIFTSHAPAITDTLDLHEVRVLQRSADGTVIQSIDHDLFDVEQLSRLQRELRLIGTEFLFARAVLLCEGASEDGALPEFAAKLDIDLDLFGITIVSVGGSGFEPFLKLLSQDGFDIPHCLVCDNDKAVKGLLKTLARLDHLPDDVDADEALDDDGREALAAAGFFTYDTSDIEAAMVDAGGYASFEGAADLLYGKGALNRFRKRHVESGGADDDTIAVQKFGKKRDIRKPELAAEAASRMDTVPADIERLLRHCTALVPRTTSE